MGPNCVGLTKMLTATVAFSPRALLTRDMCPSCRKPMVGTRPSGLAAHLQTSRNSDTDSIIFILVGIPVMP